ncbi:hypothetical protein ASE39_20270 [Acidovorax sp. Root267]|uniref:DUF3592 domain-containing protein n=1 Tax=Acidovorax sp. Root267 TaxID=1736505 RepID=UPI000710BA3B|nr:DUF3592 domain-containing protein [Acidovorax sp. Root267]KRD26561.1 hypothetical protein ASE39_20270 [Acidovorax sp. Root267]
MRSTSFRRFFGLLGWLLLVPGALMAVAASWLLATGLHIVGDTHSAKGRVVAHESAVAGPAHRQAHGKKSVVEFVAKDGRTVRFTDSLVRRLQAVHDVGDAVTVRYPAHNPSLAEISGSTTLKVFMGALGLLFGAVGMAAGWLLLRLRPRAPA